MAFNGFSLLLAALLAPAGLATLALPVRAGADSAPPVVAARIAEALDEELSDRLRPAEMPPPDFMAAQYIDSAGCVFIRTERGWRARVARDRTPVCGYPPTLSARRTGPSSAPSLFSSPEEPRLERISRELAEAIIPNLQAGELLRQGEGERDTFAAASEGKPEEGDTQALGRALERDDLGLGEMMAHAPLLSRQMAGSSHMDRVCALIGVPSEEAGGSALGVCGARPQPLALPARQATERRGAIASDPPKPQGRGAGNRTRHADRAPATDKAASPRPQVEAAARPVTEPRDDPRMIPPGARYVQVGAFQDLEMAERTAQDLAARGLPVVRSRPTRRQGQLIMVGPLEGRQAIVRMIDRLRRAGYHSLVARR